MGRRLSICRRWLTSAALLARFIALALLLSAFGTALPTAAAEKKEPPPPPPPLPVPQEIQVLRGEEREVPLKIYGRKNQPITFVIRKQPRFGRISAPVNTESEVAVVRYFPPEDRKITRDSFQYAAKSTEGVSAAVRVDIRIVDLPAQLVVTQETTFPQRLTGTEETQVIEMENQGGNIAEGEAFVDPPWKIEGPSTYRIEPHGRGFLRVKFAPEKSGHFEGEVRFSSQPDRVATVRGSAVDAIEVNPPVLALRAELTNLLRAGAVELTNHTEAPLTIRTTATEPLLLDDEIVLNPNETRPFIIRTSPADAFQVSGKVIFEAGAFKSELLVSAEPLPAVIRPAANLVNFGQLPAAPNAQFDLVLRNAGGRSGTATIVGSGPLHGPDQPVSLAPGQSTKVPITITSGTIGLVDSAVEIRSEGTVSRVAVRGGVGVSIPRIGNAPGPSGKPKAKLPSNTTTPDESIGWSPYETDVLQPVDQTKIVRVAALTPTSCSIDWSKDLSKAPRFIAEIRQLAFANGELVQNWRPHAGFHFERQADRIRGTIDEIEPGKLYTIRVRGQEPGSPPGAVVFQMGFSTPLPEKSSFGFGWKSWLVGIALACLAIAYWRRHRNPPVSANFDARKTQRIFD